jgi:hypothetical protein
MRFVYDVELDVVRPFMYGGAMEPPVNVNIKTKGCRPVWGKHPFVASGAVCW